MLCGFCFSHLLAACAAIYYVLQYVIVRCSVLQCVVRVLLQPSAHCMCCSVLQFVAVCCSVLQCVAVWCRMVYGFCFSHLLATCVAVLCMCCSTLQCLTVCCSMMYQIGFSNLLTAQPWVILIVPHYNTLQHTATYCNTLKHTTTHCKILQHTATREHITSEAAITHQ